MASTVKHLRSSTASKRPTASGLAEGQLAINTASGTPGLFLKDSAGAVVKVGPVHVGASAPNAVPAGSAGNSTGELWVNNSTTIHGLNYYTGSAFVNLTPSGTATVAGLVELATNAETQTGTDTVRAVTPSGLQSKVSDSTSTTSSTTIASSTAVKAAYDLADAALPKAGGRITGNLEIGPVGSLSFEGSSDDSFETTLAVVNPTADRTITLPNVTGTVITTGDSGTVTSAMIADLNIVNADINASAAIALSKLATGALPTAITVASANIVDGTITNADINASAAIAGTKISPDFGSQDITIGDKIIHAGDTNTAIRFPAVDTIAFETDGSEKVRITSPGNLLVGTTSPVSVNNVTAGLELHALTTTDGASASIARFGDDAPGPQLNFGKSRSGTLSPGTVVQNNDNLGDISFCGDDGTDINIRAALIRCEVDGTPGANDMPGRLVFSTTADGASNTTERMRITSDGDVHIANTNGVIITSGSSNGFSFNSGGGAAFARSGGNPLFIGRNTDDGNLISFYQAGTGVGSISVAGSTVSYNPFLGSHWGRLADGSKPDILPGTILDTVDQLIKWKQAKFTVDGEEKIAAYNGAAKVGDTVEIDYEGTSYSAIVQNEEEEPEELNKHVCVKVNDTASSKAVFGVFLGWDHDIPDGMVSTWNDLYCAAVGNYFVRIAEGETLEIGSLVEANGNGCGIVQEDDIIRSKTVAKITSTIPQKVYDDGSFLVTCVLCCG